MVGHKFDALRRFKFMGYRFNPPIGAISYGSSPFLSEGGYMPTVPNFLILFGLIVFFCIAYALQHYGTRLPSERESSDY